MKKFILFLVLAMVFSMFSCGGGGGGDDTTSSDSGDTSSGTDDTTDTEGYEFPDLITASLIFDADQDGDLDLVVGSTEETLLLNDGSGNFTPASTSLPEHYLGSEGITISLEAVDVNQDGCEDILGITVDNRDDTYYQSSRIQLYLNNGDGTFTDAASQISGGDIAEYILGTRVADINQDGVVDFVLAIAGCSSGTDLNDAGDCYGGRIYLNDGEGNFSLATTITTYDDSGKEYVYDKPAWPGGGSGTDTSLRVALDIFVGDMDNDGDVDIVVPNSYADGAIVTLLNESTTDDLRFKISYCIDATQGGTYDQIQVKYGALLDINNDGYLDFVASWGISESDSDDDLMPVYAYINDGAGSFTADNSIFDPEQPGLEHAAPFLTADFNNDGITDLFVADTGYDYTPFPGHENLLLINNGSGSLVDYSEAYLGTLNTFTHGASCGDVDGDGYVDLFLNNASQLADGGAHLLINDSGTGFTDADSRIVSESE